MKEIYEKAIMLLSRREHSRYELRLKLLKRFAAEDINQVLDELEKNNTLSDQRFADAYLRVAIKKFGRIKLMRELNQRGVDNEIIDAAMTKWATDEEWRRACIILGDKYKDSVIDDESSQQRAGRFLSSRGFADGDIWRAIKAHNAMDKHL